MDKFRVTNHIKDDSLKLKMFKIVDLCNSVLKNHEIKHSDFLNPFEMKNAISIVNSEPDLKYRMDGGYESFERGVLTIYPYYLYPDDIDESTDILQIDGNFKFSSVSHRDYLGSILGLGIKREKIGDILVNDDFCQIIVDKEISDFIILNLSKVSRNRVDISRIHHEQIVIPVQEYETTRITVSSMRLDILVSTVFNISRSKADSIVSAGMVYVNYENIQKSSYNIDEGSIISVRGKGKFIISKVDGITKKDRIKLEIKKYK